MTELELQTALYAGKIRPEEDVKLFSQKQLDFIRSREEAAFRAGYDYCMMKKSKRADKMPLVTRLRRFLQHQLPGYAFACSHQPQTAHDVSDKLAQHLKRKGLTAGIAYIDPLDDRPVVEQLSEHKEDVLIVMNFDDLTELSADGFYDLLLEVNLGRERLLELKKPILFWISKATLPVLSNHAADLYSQRSINTIEFLD